MSLKLHSSTTCKWIRNRLHVLKGGYDAVFRVGYSRPAIVYRSEALKLLKLCNIGLTVASLIEEEGLNLWPDVIRSKTVRSIGVEITIDQADSHGITQSLYPTDDSGLCGRITIKRVCSVSSLLQAPQTLLEPNLVVRNRPAAMRCNAQCLCKCRICWKKYSVLWRMDIEVPGIGERL